MELDVAKVPSSIYSSRMRYAVTPEQEKEIANYVNRQKTTRAKRNHLYVPCRCSATPGIPYRGRAAGPIKAEQRE
ncbi:hypothetical protein [Psychrobacillus glaciei]|uniref:hypothetical protein n=1 Tax=Psychrobacillus glaciei TaxID=2283160 RepID=UPI00124C9102|nr:hypothetical protein [Psychrobacillus glaciei]